MKQASEHTYFNQIVNMYIVNQTTAPINIIFTKYIKHLFLQQTVVQCRGNFIGTLTQGEVLTFYRYYAL